MAADATEGGTTAGNERESAARRRTTGGSAPSRATTRVRQAWAFAERCLREVGNSPTMLLSALALPAGLQLFYGTLWEDPSSTMVASTAVGTGVFGATYVCLYVFGYQLAGDLEDRRYEAYRSMPISPAADLGGRMLAGLLLAAVSFSLTIAAGAVTGGSFALRSLASVPLIATGFVLTCVIWMVVAMPIVVYAENERVAEYAVPMIAMLGYVGTGFNGATVDLAPVGGEVLNYLPNTLPTRLLVYHLVPAGEWTEAGLSPPAMPAGLEFVALLVAYAAITLVVGAALVNRVLYDRGWWA